MFKYWDIIGGIITGLIIAFISDLNIEIIQLCYSIIILILVSIGLLRIIKEKVEKQKDNKRKHNIIDSMVDKQKSVKAINLAESPTKEGEKLGKFLIILIGGLKRIMNKIKTFFDKFKGFMLTFLLGALTFIETNTDIINSLFNGVLVFNGIKIIPLVTLILTMLVGIISNGFTKEQYKKIKSMFSKSTTNEIVIDRIKTTLKEKNNELSLANRNLILKEHELKDSKSELVKLNNTLKAVEEMFNMTPQLSTESDVSKAKEDVSNCENKIIKQESEINGITENIKEIESCIQALKSQLKI